MDRWSSNPNHSSCVRVIGKFYVGHYFKRLLFVLLWMVFIWLAVLGFFLFFLKEVQQYLLGIISGRDLILVGSIGMNSNISPYWMDSHPYHSPQQSNFQRVNVSQQTTSILNALNTIQELVQ